MCYHISNTEPSPYKMEDYYEAKFEHPEVYQPYYHVTGFAHPVLYGILQEDPSIIEPVTWGIVEPDTINIEAYWKANGGKTLNTQSEFAFSNKRTATAIMENRCIIPVTGFFEPHRKMVNNKDQSYPFYIGSKAKDYISLLGCYYEYDTGLYLFTILTAVANPLLAKIHNKAKRMPIMCRQDLIHKWLDDSLTESEIKEIMYTDTDQELNYYPVKKEVLNSRVKTDTEDALTPVDYPELNTRSLFD